MRNMDRCPGNPSKYLDCTQILQWFYFDLTWIAIQIRFSTYFGHFKSIEKKVCGSQNKSMFIFSRWIDISKLVKRQIHGDAWIYMDYAWIVLGLGVDWLVFYLDSLGFPDFPLVHSIQRNNPSKIYQRQIHLERWISLDFLGFVWILLGFYLDWLYYRTGLFGFLK